MIFQLLINFKNRKSKPQTFRKRAKLEIITDRNFTTFYEVSISSWS